MGGIFEAEVGKFASNNSTNDKLILKILKEGLDVAEPNKKPSEINVESNEE